MHPLFHRFLESTLFPFLTVLESLNLCSTNQILRKKWIPKIMGHHEWSSDACDVPLELRRFICKLYPVQLLDKQLHSLIWFPNLLQLKCANEEFRDLKQLSSLTSLDFYAFEPELLLPLKHLPPTLTYLRLSSYVFIQMIGTVHDYPASLTTMDLDAEIVTNVWPPHLTELNLGLTYQPLNEFPPSLTALTLDLTNRPLHDLPTTITSLCLGAWKDGNITFPASLKRLTMDEYNLPTLPTFPLGLTELELRSWNHSTHDGLFPVHLLKLSMFAFDQCLIHVPPDLQVLELPNVDNESFVIKGSRKESHCVNGSWKFI